MQTIEASFSLLFFLSILASIPVVQDYESRLYPLLLAEDSWRVLYLRNGFHDFGDAKREAFESSLDELSAITGFCYHLSGIRFSNCRGLPSESIMTIQKTIIYDGYPRNVTFTVSS